MGKTIRFNENGLIAIKNGLNEITAGNDDVVSPNDVVAGHKKELDDNISNEFAPVTRIGAEPNSPMGGVYYHMESVIKGSNIPKEFKSINEGYYRGCLNNIDLSDVGSVKYSFYFDEDEYNEWLEDNELDDSEESRKKYYLEEYLYDVEYYDYETLHYMDEDQSMCYDDIEDLFGEDMANKVLNDCMTKGGGSFDTDELYADCSVDLNNPYEVNDIAVKMFPHGEYYRDARGFILTNGVMVYTEGEHNEIERIPGMDANGPGAGKFEFIMMGNIRVLPNSVDIGREPTWEQEQVLKRILREYDGEEFYVDLYSGGDVIGAAYPSADCNYVLGEIDRFYSEGIRPQGGSFRESKKGKNIIIPENKLGIITENSTDRRVNSIIAKYSGINDFDEIRKKRAEILRAVPNARAKNDMYLGAVAMYYLTGCLDSEYRLKLNRLLAALNKGVGFGYHRILGGVDFNMTPFDKLKKILDSVVTSEKSVESYEGANKDEKIQRVGQYTIYRMDSYDDTKYLGEKFKGVDTWCVFNEDDMFHEMFDGYTSYLCVRDGYENAKYIKYGDLLKRLSALNMGNVAEMIEEEYPEDDVYEDFLWDIANDNYDDELCDALFKVDSYKLGLPPCDDYGLSMMVVMVSNNENTFGSLGAVYSRYNLPNLFDGDILDENELSEVIGAPYQSVFKPYKNEEIEEESKKSKKVIIPENKLATIKENIEKEIESSEVDLSSFRKRDTLPPKIWKDEDTLDSRVRLKLLDIADDFWEFVNLTWVEPKGIIMTGSMCNFNWSEFSDIDLHIIVDFNEVDEKKELVKQYLDSKKNEWNNEHEGLKIMGFPVEVYVQDVDDSLEAGGIYDLEENAWTRKPNSGSIKSIGLDKFSIKDKAAEIMTIIDDMYNMFSSTNDLHKIEEIGDDAHYLWDKVKDLRKKSLDKHGESGSGNIVYKVLRRTGYLERLFKLFSKVYDRSNSISENVKKYLTVLKEEVAMDGSSEGNPYAKRWKEERDALKDFIANYGKLMQSKEDNKMGKLYKVYYDKTMSELIGYNYCICVQWDEVEMKPGSTVYIRALDKFTPFIRRNLQFDDRGRDNVRGNYDDIRY